MDLNTFKEICKKFGKDSAKAIFRALIPVFLTFVGALLGQNIGSAEIGTAIGAVVGTSIYRG